MLTWNVTYHCKPGQRDEFYNALCALGDRANSLTEAGNVKYDYFFAAEAPDDLLLVETWTAPALHSYTLTLTHPVTGEILRLTAPLPDDMARLISEP